MYYTPYPSTKAYLQGLDLGEADPRSPEIVIETPDFDALESKIHSDSPKTHFILSHAPEDQLTSEQLIEDLYEFLHELLPGIPFHRLVLRGTRHFERLQDEVENEVKYRAANHRDCLHVELLNIDLFSKKNCSHTSGGETVDGCGLGY